MEARFELVDLLWGFEPGPAAHMSEYTCMGAAKPTKLARQTNE